MWHYQDATPDPMITASNKNVYVESGETLLVLNGDTGTIRWKKASIVSRAVVADDTTVYVDTQLTAGKTPGDKNALVDATLAALSTQDGHMRWSTPVINLMPDQSRTFSLHQGMIILSFMSDFPYVYHFCAYKTSDGSPVWCSPKTATPSGDGILSYIVMNNTIFAIVSQQKGRFIEARNVADGKLLWSTSLAAFATAPIVSVNGVVYTIDKGISAFDSRSGYELWHFSIKGQSVLMMSFAVGSW